MTTIDLGTANLVATRTGPVLEVVIDRPERRNACTLDMYRGLSRAAALADADPAVDVLVLTGRGDVFCPGGEMGEALGGDVRAQALGWCDDFPFLALERCSKVVLAAVNGLCDGGGLDMVLTSDVSIASDRATFRAPELRRGLADAFLSARLAAAVGHVRAKALLFTAPRLTAAEAAAMGLVARVVPHDDLGAAVAETVELVRAGAPDARAAVKRDVNRRLPVVDLEMLVDSLASEEVAEGFRAFLEKRVPRWRA